MRKGLSSIIGAGAVLALLCGPATVARADSAEQELVEKARLTVEKLMSHKDYGTLREWMKDAKGVLVVPNLLKAGFLFGGEGGSGVLLSRDDKGQWSYPAFYRMAAGSFGLQIGVQSSEVIFVIMTENGLKSVVRNNVKLGGDASIAVGPTGAGVEGSTTTNLGADIYSFAMTSGAFAGVSFEGSVAIERNKSNAAYYKKGATAVDIVLKRRYSNRGADGLRRALGRKWK